MSIKSILILVDDAPSYTGPLSVALELASSMRAVLRIVHVTPLPAVPDPVSVGIYGGVPNGGAETIARIAQIEADLARAAERIVQDACQRHHVPLIESGKTIAMGQAQAVFRAVTDDARHCRKHDAATVDLIVAGYNNRGDLGPIVSSLFDGRRAVLALSPASDVHLTAKGYARSVMVAWDGSPACGRAVRDAVPFLLHADDVTVVQVCAHAGDADEQGRADVITYLRSHCVKAQFIFRERDGRKTGDVLLDEAQRLKAGLLVMGAYGRGHVGETLLGGVSNHVLKHTTLPLLLAH